MIVYTMPKRVTDLTAGDIVVSNGRALYLGESLPAMTGTRVWAYTRYEESPTGAHKAVTGVGSEITFRADTTVTVVCVTLDGSVVTP